MKSAKEWQKELAGKKFPESVSQEAIKRVQADAIRSALNEVMIRPAPMLYPAMAELLKGLLPDDLLKSH